MTSHESLRKRFNPEGSDLRRQQMVMLEILSEVDHICRAEGIRYWLSSGTLLGAVRHGGFIPWDDDLDIEMMRDDYRRFIEIMPRKLPEGLVLQTIDTDTAFYSFYAKIRERGSHISETGGYDRILKYRGIYIDVFPLEDSPEWIHRISETAQGHVYKLLRTSCDDSRIIPRTKKITHFNRHVTFPLLRLLTKILPGTLRPALGIPFRTPRDRGELFPLKEMLFEGRKFFVPHDSDAYLRRMFGDYTQLPDLSRLKLHIDEIKFAETVKGV